MIKHLILPRNPKYGGYERGFASIAYELFDKKFLAVVSKMRICQTVNRRITQTNY